VRKISSMKETPLVLAGDSSAVAEARPPAPAAPHVTHLYLEGLDPPKFWLLR